MPKIGHFLNFCWIYPRYQMRFLPSCASFVQIPKSKSIPGHHRMKVLISLQDTGGVLDPARACGFAAATAVTSLGHSVRVDNTSRYTV